MTNQIANWSKRLLTIAVGLMALAISGLTLWMCLTSLLESSDPTVSRFTLWTVLGFLAGIAIALALFGLRLIVPRLRLEGWHVIGMQGLLTIAFFYALLIGIGLFTGGHADARLIPALAVLFAVGTLIRERMNGRIRQ